MTTTNYIYIVECSIDSFTFDSLADARAYLHEINESNATIIRISKTGREYQVQ